MIKVIIQHPIIPWYISYYCISTAVFVFTDEELHKSQHYRWGHS